ncbi:MAG: putative fatty-acid--CoA ligase [Actinomycetia bacterium]|nr:putative fatty-acid--CoA ligase [Actinomycetes bacterium]
MTTTPSSLLPRLEAAASTEGAITFLGSAGANGAERVAWRELHHDARAMAAALQRLGIAPRANVAILGPTTRSLVTAIQATWLCGAATVMLPLPMRLASIEDFVHQTRARIRASDAALVLVDRQLAAFLDPQPADPPIVLLDELVPGVSDDGAVDLADTYDRPADDPEALAILQYTSGSTSDPKGVMLPHRCVAANIDSILEAAELDPRRDVGVSWLPLYHDMGLIGLLATPMTTGMDLALAAPQDFLAAPARWMEWMAEYRGTATAGPNFAYALAARALRRMDTLDLSAWRIALNGAEPIDPNAVASFVDAGARHGVKASSVFPAFGMAEATLAVTFVEPGMGLRVDTVDRRVLETDSYAAPVTDADANARHLARLGRAIPGIEIRICDAATGGVMRDREVGELEIRGTSVTPGYYKNAHATAAVFHDGWLRTGDLAYTVDGELVVCGRIKDLIILGGRNVYPQDVERAVADIDGVRAGNVIAFGTEGRKGKEALVVVLEAKTDEEHAVRDAVANRVRAAVGVPAEEVVLVRPGTLPKTSSGKLQRTLCRERYLGAELELI